MARADLMALTPDDLVTLSNRGLAKRAQQEMESGQYTCVVTETEAGDVEARWSDGVVCRIAAGSALSAGVCTCDATTLCRHLLRSVLAYQRWIATSPTSETSESDRAPSPLDPAAPSAAGGASWDPGAITDAELARSVSKAVLARARRLYDEGVVVEIVRSTRPRAFLHSLSCTIRFLVPGDVRYVHCDCAEAQPCTHVPLAVWAFRLSPGEEKAALVSTGRAGGGRVDSVDLVDAVDAEMRDLVGVGVAGMGPAHLARIRRLEERLRSAGLVWPADIVAEIVLQSEAYAAHDSRFSPRELAASVGELLIRGDAIRAGTGAVPQLFVRGSATDRVTELGSSRLVGLGCGVRVRRQAVSIEAYVQDTNSGLVMAMTRDVPDPAADSPDQPRSFAELAGAVAAQRSSYAAVGSGQLLITAGKRTANCRLTPGRNRTAVNPQSFQWESLRSPVLVDDYAELGARCATMPPPCLRPRRLGEDIVVCAVDHVDGLGFSAIDGEVQALLHDASGGAVALCHPYTSRGAEGCEALIAALADRSHALRFAAGHVRRTGAHAVLEPISLVFERNGVRRMVQPWVDWFGGNTAGGSERSSQRPGGDPIGEYLIEITDLVGDMLTVGLRGADAKAARDWDDLRRRGAALGFDRVTRPIEQVADELAAKLGNTRWDPASASDALLTVAAAVPLALEV